MRKCGRPSAVGGRISRRPWESVGGRAFRCGVSSNRPFDQALYSQKLYVAQAYSNENHHNLWF